MISAGGDGSEVGTVSAAGRLRRLRLVLTGLFTAMNALGLVVFAGLVIREDAEQGRARLDAALRPVTSTVTRLIQYDGTLVTAFVGRDELSTACPQFAILPAGAGRFEPYASRRTCVEVADAVLADLATDAVASGRLLNGYVRGSGDALVRIGAEPFRNPAGDYLGAVVAAVDAGPEQSRHDRFTRMVGGGCLLAIAAVAGAGYLLAGRAIRPAAAALEQQELLLAETAHDLRTPVAALRALAETAARHPDQQAELLPRTVSLAARMGSIIDGLLIRARIAAEVERLDIRTVRLDRLVAGVIEATPSDGAQVALSAAPTSVAADAALIERAIGNLLENAMRHGHRPGEDARVHVTVTGGRVLVADYGPGIDPSVAKARFDRFHTGGGGSGLGLSIVRWIIAAHGGTLSVYNAEGAGAIFEVTLPVREG